MTSKEKQAKELVDWFLDSENDFDNFMMGDERIEYAKKLALKCQNEKIKYLGDLWLSKKINNEDYKFENGELFEVKQAINKL